MCLVLSKKYLTESKTPIYLFVHAFISMLCNWFAGLTATGSKFLKKKPEPSKETKPTQKSVS